jgi:hypothetical protein
MACPVCGSHEVIEIPGRWETCENCSAQWVHGDSQEGVVIRLPSDRVAARSLHRLRSDGISQAPQTRQSLRTRDPLPEC